MALGAEPRRLRDRRGGRGDRALEPGRRGHVFDAPARRADEVVVVTGEVLGELPACELVGAHDAVHDAGLLEHHEVAVHRALREAATGLEDLGDRQRARRLGERGDERFAVRGEALAHAAEPLGDDRAHVVGALRHACNVPEAGRAPTRRSASGQYGPGVESTEQFAALVAGPEADLAPRPGRVPHRRARAPRARSRRPPPRARPARARRARHRRRRARPRAVPGTRVHRQHRRLRRSSELVVRRRARPPPRHPDHAQRAHDRSRSSPRHPVARRRDARSLPRRRRRRLLRRVRGWRRARRRCVRRPVRADPAARRLPPGVPRTGRPAADRRPDAEQPPALLSRAGPGRGGVAGAAAAPDARPARGGTRRARRRAGAARAVQRGGRGDRRGRRGCPTTRVASSCAVPRRGSAPVPIDVRIGSPAGSVQAWQVARFRCSRSRVCSSPTA